MVSGLLFFLESSLHSSIFQIYLVVIDLFYFLVSLFHLSIIVSFFCVQDVNEVWAEIIFPSIMDSQLTPH